MLTISDNLLFSRKWNLRERSIYLNRLGLIPVKIFFLEICLVAWFQPLPMLAFFFTSRRWSDASVSLSTSLQSFYFLTLITASHFVSKLLCAFFRVLGFFLSFSTVSVKFNDFTPLLLYIFLSPRLSDRLRVPFVYLRLLLKLSRRDRDERLFHKNCLTKEF